jgi:ectoine hydroxylase-related dioxygenase (phytanoyl-CoA dioxygenase family)
MKGMKFREEIAENGFAVVPVAFEHEPLQKLVAEIEATAPRRSRAGLRHALRLPPVAAFACHSLLIGLAQEILGPQAFPFRATLFDKSPHANWLVVWHQDTALPLLKHIEQQGWGPWSVKDGVHYAHAPSEGLNQLLALRIHLDDSTESNGPLRILPGTHKLGVLNDDRLQELAKQIQPIECICPEGGIVAMRPLAVHSSSKLRAQASRRVLHLEYAASPSALLPLELAVA